MDDIVVNVIALGIAVVCMGIKSFCQKITEQNDVKVLMKEIEEEEKEKEKEKEKKKNASGEKPNEEKAMAADAVQVENPEEAEDDQEENVIPADETDQDEAAVEGRAWKCPQCGRINPTYQYACNCGNRFR